MSDQYSLLPLFDFLKKRRIPERSEVTKHSGIWLMIVNNRERLNVTLNAHGSCHTHGTHGLTPEIRKLFFFSRDPRDGARCLKIVENCSP